METKSLNVSLQIILIVIAIGIWAIVLQNAAIIPTKQNVYVQGGFINADVSGDLKVKEPLEVTGSVNVTGNVGVYNTVAVSINEVLGKDNRKYYYNNN